MFGLGWMEISLLLVVLVLFFGTGPSSRLLGRLFGAYRKVNSAKQQLTGSFNPLDLLARTGREQPADPPTEKK